MSVRRKTSPVRLGERRWSPDPRSEPGAQQLAVLWTTGPPHGSLRRLFRERVIPWEAGQTLMEALRDNNLPILASCGGCCSCATCHVFLAPEFAGSVGVSDGDEREMLELTDAFDPEVSRLACQIAYSDDYDGFVVTLAPEDAC